MYLSAGVAHVAYLTTSNLVAHKLSFHCIFFENQFDIHTHGHRPCGGQLSQVNNPAGEKAVGHGEVLA